MTAHLSPAYDLLPCPFCGGRAQFVERATLCDAYVACNDCGAHGPTECQESDDEETPGEMAARSAWNRRALPAVSREAVLDEAVAAVPKTWLDPLLTGPEAALSKDAGKWGCPDIEALLNGVANRIANLSALAHPAPSEPTLICEQCGADRYKEPCRGKLLNCPMSGTAAAPSEIQEEK